MDDEPLTVPSEAEKREAMRRELIVEIERERSRRGGFPPGVGRNGGPWELREHRIPTSFSLTEEERTLLRIEAAKRRLSQSRTIGELLEEAARGSSLALRLPESDEGVRQRDDETASDDD